MEPGSPLKLNFRHFLLQCNVKMDTIVPYDILFSFMWYMGNLTLIEVKNAYSIRQWTAFDQLIETVDKTDHGLRAKI